jgi:hypothetical protein
MKTQKIKTRSIKLKPIIGIGYWKDVYIKEKVGMTGVIHHLIIPFVRLRWGYLEAEME